jgi:hypothetical protein
MKIRKPDIKIAWSKKENDWIVWGSSTRFCGTGFSILETLQGRYHQPNIFKELERLGYDLATLKIQISKKASMDTPASEL